MAKLFYPLQANRLCEGEEQVTEEHLEKQIVLNNYVVLFDLDVWIFGIIGDSFDRV